ncbi:MFS transporter [Streptomyces rhizosphaericus]|uniref:MFS transporter n=1 Tax=Streptomyces rhizosphaericus TaxID=114699 RepID=A0A6G4A9B9_9ACTN|nr:MFS transporter [Streptomyces rhizosphaericus]NEW69434.1 MFS transporter [Streptomyces rhizosphaericus]
MSGRYAMGCYLGGAAAARAGDEMSGPALLLAGPVLTGSPSSGPALLAGIMAAAAVGGPLFGVLLDRSSRPGRLLAVALALYAAGLAAILMGLGRVPFALTVLLAVGAGLPAPALSGGWTSQLPWVAPPPGLPRATALDAMTFSLAALVGPALAGAVAGAAGAPAAVAVSIALIGLALPAAWALPAPARSAPVEPPATSVVADLTAGLRVIARNRPLARATATSVVSCVGQGALLTCWPPLGAAVLGGADRGALLLSATAASALVANAVLSRRPRPPRPDTVLLGGALLLVLAPLLAATGHPAALIAAVLLTGTAEGPQLTALFAIRHREAPERLRGQVFTTGASLKITGFALGAALAGPLATWSLPGALVVAGGCEALAVLVFVCLPGTTEAVAPFPPPGAV